MYGVKEQKEVREPGLEPGSRRWQRHIVPLDHSRVFISPPLEVRLKPLHAAALHLQTGAARRQRVCLERKRVLKLLFWNGKFNILNTYLD